MNNSIQWRFSTIAFSFTLVGVVVFLQLVRIQFSPQVEDFREQGNSYSGFWRTVYPARGQVYDRWGHLLAGNRTVYQLGVDLNHVDDPAGIAFALNLVLNEDYARVYQIVSQEPTDTAVYAVITDFVTPEQVNQIKQLGDTIGVYTSEAASIKSLDGLVFTPHLMRAYPEETLAANILGFVSRNGEGYFGVEEKYHDLLAGEPRTIWFSTDPNKVEQLPDIPPGASIVLTIDREIQNMLEQVLDDAVRGHGAEAGTIVVMDPNNGEVLGIAVTPRINLNDYWLYPELISGLIPFNRGISKAYEPGSVFKVLTIAAALDNGNIEPGTLFQDTGAIEIGGATIKNWNQGAWGEQDMVGCLQHSLNVCLAWVASQMGPSDFYSYMSAFGFGHTTSVDLAGEVSGRLKTPGDSDWYVADLGTNSFGQGISATPLQMVSAVSALANEGKMYAPHLLRSLINNGRQYNPQPQLIGTPISPETARTITLMLASSLENEASISLVPGYRLAGKTGTAEIPTPYGYTSNVTHTSFVGWGPVDDPAFVVYIWLEKPSSSIWGSEVAAPVFRQVVEQLVVLMDIPPDDVREALGY